MAEYKADADSIRNAIRWGLMLAAVGTAGFRLPRLINEFRAWRSALALEDTATSESWHRVFTVESIGVLVVLAIGLGAFYVLRPRAKAAK
jgi:hypothetical protein